MNLCNFHAQCDAHQGRIDRADEFDRDLTQREAEDATAADAEFNKCLLTGQIGPKSIPHEAINEYIQHGDAGDLLLLGLLKAMSAVKKGDYNEAGFELSRLAFQVGNYYANDVAETKRIKNENAGRLL